MKYLEGKVFKVPRPEEIYYRRATFNLPNAFPICEYIIVKEVFQLTGQWFFRGVNNKNEPIEDRTIFLKYYDEVTDPAELVLFGPT